jgi:Bacteriophage Mu Gam like protein
MGDAEIIHIQTAPVREDFRVDTLARADWVLEVLAASDARKEENKRLAAEAKRRADEWLTKVNGQEDRDTAFLRAQLESFMASQRPIILGGKTEKKSRSLPHGTLGWRFSPKRLEVVDTAATLAWARGRPLSDGIVRFKPVLEHAGLVKVAEREGLTPPGTKWIEAQDEPFAKPLVPSLPKKGRLP